MNKQPNNALRLEHTTATLELHWSYIGATLQKYYSGIGEPLEPSALKTSKAANQSHPFSSAL